MQHTMQYAIMMYVHAVSLETHAVLERVYTACVGSCCCSAAASVAT